jgi:uncharacterized protein YndB with AHSA1/START domain
MRDGTIERRDDGTVLHYVRRLDHPVERVWEALAQPSGLVGWLADADVDLREGGRVELRWLNSDDEGNQAIARGTVSALDPPRLLEFDTDIHGRLRWELRPDGDGCVLDFTVTTPAPEEYLAMVAAGWHIHLEHLADALDGRPVDWPAWDAVHKPRWQEHHERYAALAAAS